MDLNDDMKSVTYIFVKDFSKVSKGLQIDIFEKNTYPTNDCYRNCDFSTGTAKREGEVGRWRNTMEAN